MYISFANYHLSFNVVQFSSVQSLSCVWLFATPWILAHQASLSITNSWSLLRFMSIKLMMPSNHLIICCPLLLLLSIFPNIRVFANKSVLCIKWPKYWSFSFTISPSDEYSGLFSFRIDWFDLLVVQGTLKSLLQHHSSKASILQCLAFFMVQFSHPYMTTGKTIALIRWTLISLLFNMLSRLVNKIKSVTVTIVSPSICHEVMGPNAMIFVFWMLSFKTTFRSSLSLSSRGFWVPLHFLP